MERKLSWAPLECLLCLITSVVSALLIKHMGTYYVSPCYTEQRICPVRTSAEADSYPLSGYETSFCFFCLKKSFFSFLFHFLFHAAKWKKLKVLQLGIQTKQSRVNPVVLTQLTFGSRLSCLAADSQQVGDKDIPVFTVHLWWWLVCGIGTKFDSVSLLVTPAPSVPVVERENRNVCIKIRWCSAVSYPTLSEG